VEAGELEVQGIGYITRPCLKNQKTTTKTNHHFMFLEKEGGWDSDPLVWQVQQVGECRGGGERGHLKNPRFAWGLRADGQEVVSPE
jgi:hypothetical protein